MRDQRPSASHEPEEQASPKPMREAFKAFMKVHWRITLAIICTLGVIVMPFADEEVPQRVGGTLLYLVGAIVFWTLHKRHTASQEGPAESLRTHPAGRLDTSVDDGWSRRLASCRDKAATFHEVGSATRSDTVREWLASMADELGQQLIQADDLAAIGRAVEPGFDGRGLPTQESAREAWSRLGRFESGLEDAVNRAAVIRMNSLDPAEDMASMRVQMDLLRSQLPSLDP